MFCACLWVHESNFDVWLDLLQEVEILESLLLVGTSVFNVFDVFNEVFVVGMSDRNICCSQNIDQKLGLTDGVDRHGWLGSDLGLELPLESESRFERRKNGPVWSKLDLIDNGIILNLFAAAHIILCFLSSGINLLVNLLSSLERGDIKESVFRDVSGIGICCCGFFSFLFLV